TIPSLAFQTILGKGLGGGAVTISITLFVFSTIIAIVYYGEKQAEYLFGIKFSKVMRVIYIASILLGAIADLEFIYQFMDFMLALVIIPNMLGLLLLSGKVKELKDEFFKNSKYYDKA
ncbi:MAG: alanine:cation symporter family protein, partial [Tissierellales bacterium]